MVEVLKNYKHITDEIKHIEEEIHILRSRAMSPRQPIISDMPKGSPIENDAMAALMVKFEELEEKYKVLLNDLLDKQRDIESIIESLDPLERELIRYRYIDGWSWHKIQIKFGCSRRTIFRLHSKILKKIENVAPRCI